MSHCCCCCFCCCVGLLFVMFTCIFDRAYKFPSLAELSPATDFNNINLCIYLRQTQRERQRRGGGDGDGMSEKANKLFKEIECKELSEFLFVYYLSRIYYGLRQRDLWNLRIYSWQRNRFECELNQHSFSIGDCVKWTSLLASVSELLRNKFDLTLCFVLWFVPQRGKGENLRGEPRLTYEKNMLNCHLKLFLYKENHRKL